jgi:hypothetical protein
MNRFNPRKPIVFLPEDARQDKIEIFIGSWHVAAVDQTISEFISFLGQWDRSRATYPHRLFQAAESMRMVPSSQKVKIIRKKHGVAPLISGELKIKRTIENRFSLQLQVSINPTKFNVYCPRHRNRNGINNTIENDLLFRRLENFQNRFEDEYSLDQKDNVLLSPAAKFNASSRNYETNFKRYISEIIDYIQAEIDDFSSFTPGFNFLGLNENYSLRTLESYWELADDQPILTVRGFTNSFRRLFNDTLISEFSGAHIETDVSAVGLRVDLRKGERLKIYAKTNKRIRIEVEHKYKENIALSNNRKITAGSIDELWEKIIIATEKMKTMASKNINSLRTMTLQSNTSPLTAINFITRIYDTIENRNSAKKLTMLLLVSGGVPRSILTDEQISDMQKLARAKIVQYRGGASARYFVHSSYAESVMEFFPE